MHPSSSLLPKRLNFRYGLRITLENTRLSKTLMRSQRYKITSQQISRISAVSTLTLCLEVAGYFEKSSTLDGDTLEAVPYITWHQSRRNSAYWHGNSVHPVG